ncbi:hypothetical protein GPA19_05405 [Azoarcus indigens]|uniref:Uncharacterized protein n=1 Tax=Azoarcus indigens TaxID=29545 RepID=A0A4R6DWK2_9RHOO|nr:hypothetical protein [Azoarcus indigens]NMG64382.1 hypothetical protein [Azoarcus indigens]TDN49164.1 hypothetical protein C7389_11215 [Azoarcus indigens]
MTPIFTYHLRSVLPGDFRVAAGNGLLVAVQFGVTWSAVAPGAVRVSEDGGASWEPVSPPFACLLGNANASADVWDIHFNGSAFGFEVMRASGGQLCFLTSAGGRTWNVAASSVNPSDFVQHYPGGVRNVVGGGAGRWVCQGYDSLSEQAFLAVTAGNSLTVAGRIQPSNEGIYSGAGVSASPSGALMVTGMATRASAYVLRAGGGSTQHAFPAVYGDFASFYAPSAGFVRPSMMVSPTGAAWEQTELPVPVVAQAQIRQAGSDPAKWRGAVFVCAAGGWLPIATVDGRTWQSDVATYDLVDTGGGVRAPAATGKASSYPVGYSGAMEGMVNAWTLMDERIHVIHRSASQTYVVEAVPIIPPSFWRDLRGAIHELS